MPPKKAVASKIHYVCSGLILLATGTVQIEKYFWPGMGSILLGFILLVYFIFCLKRRERFPKMDASVNFIEGLGYIIIGVVYFLDGKHYIHFLSFFAALLFMVSAVFLYLRAAKSPDA